MGSNSFGRASGENPAHEHGNQNNIPRVVFVNPKNLHIFFLGGQLGGVATNFIFHPHTFDFRVHATTFGIGQKWEKWEFRYEMFYPNSKYS